MRYQYVAQVLVSNQSAIIAEASRTLERWHLPNYDPLEETEVAGRLRQLLRIVLSSLACRSAEPMVEYAARIAEERRRCGFGLRELQGAFGALQEAIWGHLLSDLPPERRGEGIAVVDAVVGAGKDALAAAFATTATGYERRSVDVVRLFRGTAGI